MGHMGAVVRAASLLALVSGVSACSNAPSLPFLGAYFPDWLFCIGGAVLLSMVLHAILARRGLGGWLAPSVLTYPLLTALIALGAWLLFFQS